MSSWSHPTQVPTESRWTASSHSPHMYSLTTELYYRMSCRMMCVIYTSKSSYLAAEDRHVDAITSARWMPFTYAVILRLVSMVCTLHLCQTVKPAHRQCCLYCGSPISMSSQVEWQAVVGVSLQLLKWPENGNGCCNISMLVSHRYNAIIKQH